MNNTRKNDYHLLSDFLGDKERTWTLSAGDENCRCPRFTLFNQALCAPKLRLPSNYPVSVCFAATFKRAQENFVQAEGKDGERTLNSLPLSFNA
ncbi:hypothetical protein RRG08_018064 [Elysia crispata]|uniref:Uncharacterized protein n=1 Tax=Elysia crispata TaxID=231223 RepID=A0AAE0ZD21_9GAST|nr:hypothetical protein RRG08_018064 [Elysia crispata]